MPLATAAARSPPASPQTPVPVATVVHGDSQIGIAGDPSIHLAGGVTGQIRRQIKPYLDDAVIDPYPGEPLVVHGLPSRRLRHRVTAWAKLGLVVGTGGLVFGVGAAVCAVGVAVLVGAILALAGAIIYAAEAAGLCALAVLVLGAAGSASSSPSRGRRRR